MAKREEKLDDKNLHPKTINRTLREKERGMIFKSEFLRERRERRLKRVILAYVVEVCSQEMRCS